MHNNNRDGQFYWHPELHNISFRHFNSCRIYWGSRGGKGGTNAHRYTECHRNALVRLQRTAIPYAYTFPASKQTAFVTVNATHLHMAVQWLPEPSKVVQKTTANQLHPLLLWHHTASFASFKVSSDGSRSTWWLLLPVPSTITPSTVWAKPTSPSSCGCARFFCTFFLSVFCGGVLLSSRHFFLNVASGWAAKFYQLKKKSNWANWAKALMAEWNACWIK